MRTASRLLWHGTVLALVAVAAWHFIDFGELLEAFAGLHWSWLALLFSLATVDRFMMADKWRRLLVAAGVPVRFGLSLSAYYQASFLQRLLPSSLSGDVLRAVVVCGQHGHASRVLASIVVERLLGMVAALLLAMAGVTLAVSLATPTSMLFVALTVPGLLAITSGVILLSVRRPLVGWILERIPGRRLRSAVTGVYGDYLQFTGRPRLLVQNFLYCVAEQSVQVALLFSAALALNVNASVPVLLAAISISLCVRKFAILIESWVLGEASHVLVCAMLGIARAPALAFSLLAHAVAIVAALPGGVLLARSTVRLGDVRSLADVRSLDEVRNFGGHAAPLARLR